MKIYKLGFDVNNFKSVKLKNGADYDFYTMFDGRRLLGDWNRPEVVDYTEDKHLKNGDAPGFNIPLFTRRAMEILYPVIEKEVEVLPIKYGSEELFGINVINILEAIDYGKSEYLKYGDGKRIMAFKKYVFIDERVVNSNIFKISDMTRGDIFISEAFEERVQKNGLNGFKNELVYDSGDGGTENKEDDLLTVSRNNRFEYCAELEDSVKDEINNEVQKAKKFLHISANNNADSVKKIYSVVEEYFKDRKNHKIYKDVTSTTIGLGALYGQLICQQYGWRWKAVGNDKEEYFISIVSPKETHCFFPLLYMQQLFKAKENEEKCDNTIILLFNMIKDLKENDEGEKLMLIS